MRNVDVAVERYIAAIKASQEYLDYVKEKDKVKQFPELKKQIDEFRRRNYEMQNSEDTAFETVEQFESEYAKFLEKPLVEDFLAAELAFCRLMQELELKIVGSLDFE